MVTYPSFTAPAAQRHMTNQFENQLDATELTQHKVISSTQLPILIAEVNGLCFANLLFEVV